MPPCPEADSRLASLRPSSPLSRHRRSHACMEPFEIALRRQLSAMHPVRARARRRGRIAARPAPAHSSLANLRLPPLQVYKLMLPHFRYTLVSRFWPYRCIPPPGCSPPQNGTNGTEPGALPCVLAGLGGGPAACTRNADVAITHPCFHRHACLLRRTSTLRPAARSSTRVSGLKPAGCVCGTKC